MTAEVSSLDGGKEFLAPWIQGCHDYSTSFFKNRHYHQETDTIDTLNVEHKNFLGESKMLSASLRRQRSDTFLKDVVSMFPVQAIQEFLRLRIDDDVGISVLIDLHSFSM